MGAIAILGVFVADTAYRAARQPRMGETVLGKSFTLGPGGKGSNQAVAAARAGGEVCFLTRLGDDAFADLAMRTWAEAGVRPRVVRDPKSYTGAACIFIDEATGDNAIIIAPGAAGALSPSDVDAEAEALRAAVVFVTQLEQPLDAAIRALEIARSGGAVTILNPAPAAELPDAVLRLCDWVIPNESEAEALVGRRIADFEDAERAAEALMGRGAGAAIVTLGERGALLRDAAGTDRIPALRAGDVVETTGAGDAFVGGFSAALARGDPPRAAARFAAAAAALSVTRTGAAASMPRLDEIEALLRRAG